ncbi:uncharacterized protein [Hoplias malabaricus]|uniref:uncharacterized protein isoform X2 n=1 Tax=Hoplias malabaricus TaxID=27720 RepID=UPI003461D6A1
MSKIRAKYGSCSVVGCTEQHKSVHRLPASESTRAEWMKFIFKGTIPDKLSKNLYVCTNHFVSDCFTNLGQYNTGLATKLFLKEGSIPTIRGKTEAGGNGAAAFWSNRRNVGCQCDPQEKPKVSVATQLSALTLRRRRSKAVQVNPVNLKKRQADTLLDDIEDVEEPQDPHDTSYHRSISALSDSSFVSLSRGGSDTASRMEWDLSDEMCDSDSDRTCNSDVWEDNEGHTGATGSTVRQRNGKTAPGEIELVLTRSMINKPSAAPKTSRKGFARSSFASDKDENSDLTESNYVDLNREVLVLLMFRCLDCSNECRVQGKGKGGNLTIRQECVTCSNCRVWTSKPASTMKNKVRRERSSDNLNSDQECRPHLDRNPVREEADAKHNNRCIVVKQEVEDDYEKETEGLIIETYEDNDPVPSIKKENVVEDDGFNAAGVTTKDESSKTSQTSLTGPKEEFNDGDSRDEFSVEERHQDDSEDDSEASLWSLYEPTDSLEEELSETELTSESQKICQNTIKPIIWCVDCGAVENTLCSVQKHQQIYGCADCGTGDSAENFNFKDFSVHFSDVQSFHRHAVDVHGATENVSELMICQDCHKTFTVQTDKTGNVYNHKIKPFSCNSCRKSYLKKMRRRNTHICKYCMSVFNTKMSKLEHEQTHSKDQLPYVCSKCPEKFNDYVTRNQHLKSHRGQKKHISNIQNYERHVGIHQGGNLYLKSHICEMCGEIFNHNTSLRSHLLHQHGIDSTLVSVEEKQLKGGPSNTASNPKFRKRRRKNSENSAAVEEPEMEEFDPDYWEESQDSDYSEEEEEERSKYKARRRKREKRQNYTNDNQ